MVGFGAGKGEAVFSGGFFDVVGEILQNDHVRLYGKFHKPLRFVAGVGTRHAQIVDHVFVLAQLIL